jgi:hypothetical protein
MAANGSQSVRIEGLRKLNKAFRDAEVNASDQKELMHSLGQIVVRAAVVPADSGLLSTTVRAGRGKSKAVVRAGGAKTPYAGVIHYGWPQHNIAPNPFLLNALASTTNEVVDALSDGIGDVLRKANLK